jgi:hypothetical protein
MNMKKKSYEAPAVRKVRLVIRNAILGTCHSSPDFTPQTYPVPCLPSTGCYYPR